MIRSDRIRDMLSRRNLSQSELARRVGVTQATIAKLVTGKVAGSSHIHRIARELGTTPAYLTGEADDSDVGALPIPTAENIADQIDAVMVPLYNFAASMGPGAIFDEATGHEDIPFKKTWLRSHVSGRLDQVIMIYGRGDSMKPTIDDGDVLMVDRSQTVITDPDLIWAFSYGDAGYVKRLRRLPKGGYLVQSDNAVVRDFKASDDEVNIVGRVVSILRWQ